MILKDNRLVQNPQYEAISAFNEGPPGRREVDFIELRQRPAAGQTWDEEMFRAIDPLRVAVAETV